MPTADKPPKTAVATNLMPMHMAKREMPNRTVEPLRAVPLGEKARTSGLMALPELHGRLGVQKASKAVMPTKQMIGTPMTVPPTEVFLVQLPRVLACANYAFRTVRCHDTRSDLIAEVLALAWSHFVSLTRRRRNPETFVTVLAMRCSQAVRSGRRLVRCDSARDVLSPVAAVRHAFAVERIGSVTSLGDELTEALADNTRSRVPDQAAFRLDFPAWRSLFRRRDRRVLDALMAGGRTSEVAARFNLSPARVSQLRRAFELSWGAFHGG